MKKITIYSILFLALFCQFSCNEDSLENEIKEIRDYLSANGKLDDAIQTQDGLFIYITEEGTFGEDKPGPSATVNVQYRGWLMDSGDTFDSSEGNTVQYNLATSNLISGMRLGLQEFKKGDKGELYIPSSLAYGSLMDVAGNPAYGVTIEAGSVIAFDISMISFY